MKVTKNYLKKIIKEEINKLQEESLEETHIEEGKVANFLFGVAASLGALAGNAQADTSINTAELAKNIANLQAQITQKYKDQGPEKEKQEFIKLIKKVIDDQAKRTDAAIAAVK